MDSEVFGDFKNWCAISCPVEGLRFDRRTLELLDSDGDGHIRTPEVVAAVEYMKSKGVPFEELAVPGEDCETKLADVISRQKDLANLAPTAEEAKAFADWQEKGKCPQVAFLGESTKAAEASLVAVESVIDAFFTPAEDLPLVTEEQDAELPLYERLNPKFAEAIADFAEKCVKPVCGEETKTLTRAGWKRVKNAFAEYRAWVAAEPVKNALAKAGLEDEERFLRFRMHLWEFLENYCTMDRLYSADEMAVFQMGVLRIDGREMSLCFHVANEAQHSALAGKSDCCVIYLKLSRPGEKAACGICAVVTAGNVSPLYVGRNGVFYDRDGKDWEAVVTKVVENQVSLAEAFWMPWKKVGAGIAGAVKKFLGDKQAAGERNLGSLTAKVPEDAKNKSGGNGSVAMASSLAAIGVSVGLVGAALASVMAAVRDFAWWQYPLSVLVAILVVSLPSVVLTYFKLRRRDLGAILNASGWAVNRKLYFSMKLAAGFTKCARRKCRCALWWWLFAVLAVGIAAAALWRWHCGCCCA
jgi:hypothetical protein